MATQTVLSQTKENRTGHRPIWNTTFGDDIWYEARWFIFLAHSFSCLIGPTMHYRLYFNALQYYYYGWHSSYGWYLSNGWSYSYFQVDVDNLEKVIRMVPRLLPYIMQEHLSRIELMDTIYRDKVVMRTISFMAVRVPHCDVYIPVTWIESTDQYICRTDTYVFSTWVRG